MRNHTSFDIASNPLEQILIDGEFDEFENFNAGFNAMHADFEDSWSDEKLLELL